MLEDDFIILNEDNFISFQKVFEEIKDDNDWDLITLTPRGKTEKKNFKNDFHRITDTQTATGYIIKHDFIRKLLPYLQCGLWLLMNGAPAIKGINDQSWKPLQLHSNFLYYDKIFAGQRPGYSDIEKQMVNYNGRFIDQNHY